MQVIIGLIVIGVILYYMVVKILTGTLGWILKGGTDNTAEEGTGDITMQLTQISDGDNIDLKSIQRQSNKPNPLEVIVKDPKFNGDSIEHYNKEVKQFEFRPQTWEQFIGQDDAKDMAQTIKKKAERGMRSHLILSAIRGHGKTTYVKLLAKAIGAELIQRVGKQLDEDELEKVVNEINNSKAPHVIFFLDEIDTTDWKVIKILNPLIEEFEISGKKIRPFIFASATINKDILIKNNPDTLDRIPHHIQFIRYTAEDICKIIKQYHQQLYSEEKVSDEIIKSIAENCKFNPRTAISLLESYIVEIDMKKVLKSNKIIKYGLTNVDITILTILSKATRPMGANALALRCGLSPNQYVREFEPFLYEFGYMSRVPSRIITDKGLKLITELEDINE